MCMQHNIVYLFYYSEVNWDFQESLFRGDWKAQPGGVHGHTPHDVLAGEHSSMSFSPFKTMFRSLEIEGGKMWLSAKIMRQQINTKLSYKNLTYVKLPRLGIKKTFLQIVSTGNNTWDVIPLFGRGKKVFTTAKHYHYRAHIIPNEVNTTHAFKMLSFFILSY